MPGHPVQATGATTSAAAARATSIPPPVHGRRDPAVVPASTRSKRGRRRTPEEASPSFQDQAHRAQAGNARATPRQSILSRLFGHAD